MIARELCSFDGEVTFMKLGGKSLNFHTEKLHESKQASSSFCCRFAVVRGIVVLEYDPVSTKL